ncbi:MULTISPECIES: transposon-transfer assisting family protein [unclassified Sedimentibacter]|uniref:transposon-transfer assisting family protein n=1 Tax=unclassified Sedimentibacter TaxID=2649220 RepID=UPI0027DEEBED|nr:transposon-transfer assisting family protein [Sedimentibacter sp. MB35-C1]WMJ77884.1 transposon-transfer assisting family protein [Sedimentibacter sp. MB35-C1]
MKTKIHFTVEELTLIKNHKNINNNISRTELIEILENSIEYSDEKIIKEWMKETVFKLRQMTDEDFYKIDYTLGIDAED